jgi:DeoR family transcriptional regulator, aga operon transcriptional repressor
MGKYERLGAILELLGRDGSLDVDLAAAELHVSAATIRRDLDVLSRQQLLTRTHGGAVTNNAAYDLPLRYKAARHASEKQRIGKAVAEMIGAGTIVGLNGGTTTTEVARALALRGDPHSSYNPSITVVTNSLNIATELAVRAHLKIVVTGGVARPQSYELIGPLASGVLEQLSLDVAVLGVDAMDLDGGATTHEESEAAINRLMASRARKVIVVADSSKLGHRAFARLLPLQSIDVLVTDTGAGDDAVRGYLDAGPEVVRA